MGLFLFERLFDVIAIVVLTAVGVCGWILVNNPSDILKRYRDESRKEYVVHQIKSAAKVWAAIITVIVIGSWFV